MIQKKTPEKKQLSAAARKACEEMAKNFPQKQGALLNVLRIIERDIGYVDEGGVLTAAEICDMPPARAWGTFTFYTTFRKKEHGKHLMWVCSTLPCALRGSENIYDHLHETLDINEHGTSKDGLITRKKAECLGACGTAPCIQLDEDYYEDLTNEKCDRIVAEIRKGVARPAGYTA